MQVSEQNLKDIELEMRDIKNSLSVFFTRMAPLYLFEVGNIKSKIPLSAVCNAVVLCVSAIGSANSFVQSLQKVFSSLLYCLLLFRKWLLKILRAWFSCSILCSTLNRG